MNIELINTGTELMLGRVLNSHQQWLCRQLADLGCVVTRQVAVADTGRDIQHAVGEALARADLVITTGGLGPTSDDITRELVAQLLGKKLRQDAQVLAAIEKFLAGRKIPMLDSMRVQALVPEGAIVLPNAFGTAPGLAMEVPPDSFRKTGRRSWLILLPGPPRELRPMFLDFVAPLLRREFPPENPFVCLTLRTAGLGESRVQERIEAPLRRLVDAGLELGYCARIGQVDVRLAARTRDAESLVANAEEIVRAKLGKKIYATGDDEIETVILRLLSGRKQTLAVAESCTGGCIAHRLTNVPGASAVFLAGLVTYSNESKHKLLGVRAETLARHGAVSKAVAREMAEGARKQTRANYGLAVTGIAGPTGGTPGKPVGTTFIGLAGAFETIVERRLNAFERQTFKQVTAQQALEILWHAISD